MNIESIVTSPTPAAVVSQAELDRCVDERMAWAARATSAVAHDLGNLVLASTILLPPNNDEINPAQEKATVDAPFDVIQHLRSMIEDLRVWRHEQPPIEGSSTLTNWWTHQGQMVRHFLSPPARMTFTAKAGNVLIRVGAMSYAMAGMLIAIDRQVRPLERLAAVIENDASAHQVCVTLESGSSTWPTDFIVPTMVRNLLAHSGCRHDLDRLLRRLDHGVEYRLACASPAA